MKMQPNRDMVEAERTTTITLPATLTRAPSPAPTIIWASWTMQVSAAQSTPVPRGLWLPPLSFICSWKHNRGRVREQENKRKKKSDVINFLYYLEMFMSESNHHLSKQVQLWKILRGNLIYLFPPHCLLRHLSHFISSSPDSSYYGIDRGCQCTARQWQKKTDWFFNLHLNEDIVFYYLLFIWRMKLFG